MCGIIGYCGEKSAAPEIYAGLKKLEYRGYDSAGVAVVGGGKLKLAKKRGRVSELEKHIAGLIGCTGIGHTRWATHGKPSDANAHPHAVKNFAIVHNGIIENYAPLKAALESRGARFSSDTDSEVVAHLLAENYSGDLLAALITVARMLKGSYALMAICSNGEEIAVACNKSPVVLGMSKHGSFVASDAPALAGVCDKICVLKDGDFALVTKSGVCVYDSDRKEVTREFTPNPAVSQDLELNGCPHYMLKELREVPAAIEKTAAAFSSVEGRLKSAISGASRIILTGCGTAYNAALVGKRYFEELCRIPAEAEIAGELRYKNPIISEDCAVIAVSQSGETADTVEAARLALALGARVVAVTNSPFSQLSRLAHVTVPVCAGPEICVAATKSYSGQVTALFKIARMLAGKYDNIINCTLDDMPALCARNIKALEEDEGLNALAHECATARGVYFLGRDIDYAVALEGSLKLKEVSYVPCEGYPAGELKHGTLALIDHRTVSVIIMTRADLSEKCENAVRQITSRGGKAAVITDLDCGIAGVPKITLPASCKLLSPLLTASALQILAYRTAVILGRDPDKPRNLAKSVTVE